MFWKDSSWEVQTEAMGRSYHTTSLSFLTPRVFEALSRISRLLLASSAVWHLPRGRVRTLKVGE